MHKVDVSCSVIPSSEATMQLLLKLTLLLFVCSSTFSYNLTRATSSLVPKPKRALTDQIHNGAESKPVMVFLDSISSQSQNIPAPTKNFYPSSKPLALVSLQQPIQVFEQDSPKQVAAQQVLYEFQQTPTNAVSNVHVKQLFQPSEITESPTTSINAPILQNYNNQPTQPSIAQQTFGQHQQNLAQNQQTFTQQAPGQNPLTNTSPNQFIQTSETIVSPVHHNTFTNHAQNYAHVSQSHPLYNIQPHHVQAHHYVPGKYLYVNGKIVYQPNNLALPNNHHNHPVGHQHGIHQNGLVGHQVHNNNHGNVLLNGNQHKLPLNGFTNRINPQAIGTTNNAGLRQKMVPPQNTPALPYNSFKPPQKSQIQQITKPSTTAVKPVEEKPEETEEDTEDAETEDDDDDAEDDAEDNAEEDEEQEGSNKYEDEDDRQPFKKYYFEEDEDDHKSEDDNDEDSSRDSSKHHVTKKKPKKGKQLGNYSKSDGYKFAEGYRTSYKSESPKKGSKKKGKKPQTVYKTVKYIKKEGQPKELEGRYSEHIPVTHKQRIIKEKWYMTKSTDE